MAVTGRSSAAIVVLIALALPGHGDESADLRRRLSDVATALASGNPEQAMECFDKQKFADYDKLRGYFDGLTSAYQVDSQIDVNDEEGTETEAKLTVHWTLTLTDPATSLDLRRDAEMTVKLVRMKNSWQIVAMAPLDIFDPQMKKSEHNSGAGLGGTVELAGV
jgi:hypothetical protein